MDSRDSGKPNHTLTNQAQLGLLGRLQSNSSTATECRFCCISMSQSSILQGLGKPAPTAPRRVLLHSRGRCVGQLISGQSGIGCESLELAVRPFQRPSDPLEHETGEYRASLVPLALRFESWWKLFRPQNTYRKYLIHKLRPAVREFRVSDCPGTSALVALACFASVDSSIPIPPPVPDPAPMPDIPPGRDPAPMPDYPPGPDPTTEPRLPPPDPDPVPAPAYRRAEDIFQKPNKSTAFSLPLTHG
jgi:hypothetical protein